MKGKTVLVTGGASGIGLATVRAFCAGGAQVAVNYLQDDAAGQKAFDDLKAEGLNVIAAPGNIADDPEGIVTHAIQTMGGLDYLINNAGTSGARTPIPLPDLENVADDIWAATLGTNLLAPFRATRAAAASLKARNGAVVNTASVAGLGIRGSNIAYAASKGALVNLTLNMARALAPDVRVNAVAPGLVSSPWIEDWSEERRRASLAGSLLGRISTPEDIADVIVFLCAGTTMINGETIKIDGGRPS
jgi:3-oxoacyl-[acyl-carrier protein] reductase